MTKLEEIFLMNVAIYFPTYSQLYTFINVNKKCLNAVKGLKRNPYFDGPESIRSFLQRFVPDTVDVNDNMTEITKELLPLFSKIKIFENPQPVFEEKQTSIVKVMLEMLGKVKYLNVHFDCYTEPFGNLVNQNTTKLVLLEKLIGRYSDIKKFFYCYNQQRGSNDYLKNLKRVIVYTTYDNSENSLYINKRTIGNINNLRKIIGYGNGIKLTCVFRINATRGEQEELLKELKDVEFFYRRLPDNSSFKRVDNYFCTDSTIYISGFGVDNYNELVNNVYAGSVLCLGRKDQSWNYTTIWQVPECVKTLGIYYYTFGTKTNLPIVSNALEVLEFYSCSTLSMSNTFASIKELHITKCINVIIDETNFPQLQELYVEDSNIVNVTLGPTIKKLSFQSDTNCGIFSDISNIEFLFIQKCNGIRIPAFAFCDKTIIIEDSKNVQFLLNNDEVSPIPGITLPKFKEILAEQIYLPEVPIVVDKNYFVMKRFSTNSPNIRIVDNVITKIKRSKDRECVFSINFYDEKTNSNDLLFRIHNGNIIEELPAYIRYFEVKVIGYCCVSIGIVHTDFYNMKRGRHIGWDSYSIGYHSDDGRLFDDSSLGWYYAPPYGLGGEPHIIGVGYDTRIKKLFYTRDGVKLKSKKVEWTRISAAIGMENFERLEINYGQKPFCFNIQQEIIQPKDEKCSVM